jgi:leader peptidase (prepilin peptidase) / N-methyltransferase
MPLSSPGHRSSEIRDLPNEPLQVCDERRLAEGTLHPTKRRFWPADRISLIHVAWGTAVSCAFVTSVAVAPGLSGFGGGGFAVIMFAIAAIDARDFRIPDILVVAGLVLGLLEVSRAQAAATVADLGTCMLRGLLFAGLFLAFRLVYRRVRGRDGLGLGDVKLAAVAGLWLDWMGALIAVDIAALSALLFVLVSLARGQKVDNQTTVPFGLFFAPAIWLVWLFGIIISR